MFLANTCENNVLIKINIVLNATLPFLFLVLREKYTSVSI